MLAAVVTALIIVFDQVSKYLVVTFMELHGEAKFIPHVISFYRTENRGAAFSMLAEHRWVFMVISFIAMGIIVWLLIKEYKRHTLLTLSLSMVLGGGIGNMIDRIRLGYVVDFLRFDFVDFAIFNVADSFITIGAVLLGVYIIFFEPKVEKRLKAEKLLKASAVSGEKSDAKAEETEKPEEQSSVSDSVSGKAEENADNSVSENKETEDVKAEEDKTEKEEDR